MQVRSVALKNLLPYAGNARDHSAEQVERIARSLREFGWMLPVLVGEDMTIIAGHARVQAARLIADDPGATIPRHANKNLVPIIVHKDLTQAQRRAYVLADNRLAEMSSWDIAALQGEVDALRSLDFDLDVIGLDAASLDELFGGSSGGAGGKLGNLSERFGVPPFSVLRAGEGWWQDRKRAWLSLGIQSELGRGANLLAFSDTVLEPDPKKRAARRKRGKG